ncbi:MAG: RNA polymerase sigma factor [Anaerolineaceae bacterium]|nr:RNA polymerase sigma factor [Anaerolineaceae bacterium]
MIISVHAAGGGNRMQALPISMDRSMTDTHNEHELLQQIAAGNQDALRSLYAAYGQRLYAYALRLTGDPSSADEVVQESLVAAWQGAGRFRGQGRVIAWLLGIVHHKALSMLRRKPTEDLDTAEDLQDPAMPTPAEQAASREDSRQVKQAVARLSSEHRAVLELVFYQGLSLDETASVLNCPLGTVKSRLSYAKASLRGELTRQGWNAEER